MVKGTQLPLRELYLLLVTFFIKILPPVKDVLLTRAVYTRYNRFKIKVLSKYELMGLAYSVSTTVVSIRISTVALLYVYTMYHYFFCVGVLRKVRFSYIITIPVAVYSYKVY